MPRRVSYRLPLDSSLFTPLQLQPTALGRIGFNAGTRWLAEHVCSHRALVIDHGVGLVVWAWRLRYGLPLGFADADDVGVDTQARVRGRQAQLAFEVKIVGPEGVAVEMEATMIPLQLTGDPSLSGAPCRLPPAILERFEAEELEDAPYRTPVHRMLAAFESDGPAVASGDASFRVNRHHCEMADQWFWAESLSFASGAREELVAQHAASVPGLLAGLADPVRTIDVVALRNYQFRDVVAVHSSAYLSDGRPAFVHRMQLGDDPAAAPHAIAVERF